MQEESSGLSLGKWEDYNCFEELPYVCKGPKSPTNPKIPDPECGITGAEKYTPFREECYYASTERLSWREAEMKCQESGAHLVSLLDWTELNYAFAFAKTESAWIGLNGIEVQ